MADTIGQPSKHPSVPDTESLTRSKPSSKEINRMCQSGKAIQLMFASLTSILGIGLDGLAIDPSMLSRIQH